MRTNRTSTYCWLAPDASGSAAQLVSTWKCAAGKFACTGCEVDAGAADAAAHPPAPARTAAPRTAPRILFFTLVSFQFQVCICVTLPGTGLIPGSPEFTPGIAHRSAGCSAGSPVPGHGQPVPVRGNFLLGAGDALPDPGPARGKVLFQLAHESSWDWSSKTTVTRPSLLSRTSRPAPARPVPAAIRSCFFPFSDEYYVIAFLCGRASLGCLDPCRLITQIGTTVYTEAGSLSESPCPGRRATFWCKNG